MEITLLFPTIHVKAHIQTQFKTSVYVYKNGTKSESDYSEVKDIFNLNTYGGGQHQLHKSRLI